MQETKGTKEIKEIKFYSKSENYTEFSNMHLISLNINNEIFKSVEHFFQHEKYHIRDNERNKKYMEMIKNSPSPFDAKRLGRNRSYQIQTNWDIIRNEVMLTALRVKFKNIKLAKLLLDTGDARLIEDSKDSYWGCGGSSNLGKNKLGQLLMQVRTELKLKSDDVKI